MSAELLERATRALRASTEPTEASADAGLERALQRLQRQQRQPVRSPWRLRTAAWTLAATLAGAGAWAHATGRVAWFASVSEPAEAPAPPVAVKARAAAPQTPRLELPEEAAVPDVPGVSDVPTVSAVPGVSDVPAVPAAPEPPPRDAALPKPTPRAQPAAPKPRAPLAEPQLDRADELYREAHAAHFTEQDYAAALAAWDRYLAAAAPAHRWTVEARFNRGVALYRLGRRAAARLALRPFAEGEYGSYRREEAARLLEALRSTP